MLTTKTRHMYCMKMYIYPIAWIAVYKFCSSPNYILYYLGQGWTTIKVWVVQVCYQLLILNKRKREKYQMDTRCHESIHIKYI
jgi:hypothetical protein